MAEAASPEFLLCLPLQFLLSGWFGAGRAGQEGDGGSKKADKEPQKGGGAKGLAEPKVGRGSLVQTRSLTHPRKGETRAPRTRAVVRTEGVISKWYTDSLWYNFTIIRLPRHGQQWCEVQGQVDQKNFLSYDCGSDKVLSMGHLEEQLDATDAWGKQLEMLREVGQRLRLELTDTELEDFTPSGPLTLQARMSCEYETDRRICGSQQFGFVGQKFLLFDSNNRKWTVVQDRARQMKEKWEDSGLTMFFQVFSIGDCKSWLRDFPMHRKKRLEPIEPLTRAPGTAHTKAMSTNLSLWSCLIILCFILPGI
ncbi:PREDICTED: NKG2D ligand 3-like [Rhinopithecus bieti]|uniref:NKG2D ligand 3-like n=1 Tax=Rhinopithecus bieti TaxID=61621 RepID=UPI00083BE35D|nr:PREDICTED: NKG2D ligand 3-like [Rhinopithecus bieti]